MVTIGSDAHHVQHLGAGLAEGEALARAAGFRAVVTFDRRRVCFLDLDRASPAP